MADGGSGQSELGGPSKHNGDEFFVAAGAPIARKRIMVKK